MKSKIIAACAALALCLPLTAGAQKWTVGTDALGWLAFGTANMDVSGALGRRWTANAEARYNPWTFREGTPGQLQFRERTAYLGLRYWPWHVYSGWHIGIGAQATEYSRTRLSAWKERHVEEGEAWGGAIQVGYAWMLGERLNLEAGIGVWAGRKEYRTYDCPQCGKVIENGNKGFIEPRKAYIGLEWFFD